MSNLLAHDFGQLLSLRTGNRQRLNRQVRGHARIWQTYDLPATCGAFGRCRLASFGCALDLRWENSPPHAKSPFPLHELFGEAAAIPLIA